METIYQISYKIIGVKNMVFTENIKAINELMAIAQLMDENDMFSIHIIHTRELPKYKPSKIESNERVDTV